jgi:hypothetical protein
MVRYASIDAMDDGEEHRAKVEPRSVGEALN